MTRDKEKKRASWRKWYHEHKDKARANKEKQHKQRTEWLQEYKKTLVCKDCGNNDFRVLCFHHTDPTIKDKEVSNIVLRGTKKQLLEEIEKCICLCMNCHTILHYEERNGLSKSLDPTPAMLEKESVTLMVH